MKICTLLSKSNTKDLRMVFIYRMNYMNYDKPPPPSRERESMVILGDLTHPALEDKFLSATWVLLLEWTDLHWEVSKSLPSRARGYHHCPHDPHQSSHRTRLFLSSPESSSRCPAVLGSVSSVSLRSTDSAPSGAWPVVLWLWDLICLPWAVHSSHSWDHSISTLEIYPTNFRKYSSERIFGFLWSLLLPTEGCCLCLCLCPSLR